MVGRRHATQLLQINFVVAIAEIRGFNIGVALLLQRTSF